MDKQSIQRVHDIFKKDTIEEASMMLCFYQLKQVQAKGDKLSTDTRCRVSSDYTSPLELQACTAWTLVDQDTTNPNSFPRKTGIKRFLKGCDQFCPSW